MRESILEQLRDNTTNFKKVGDIADISAVMHGENARSKIILQNLPGAFLHFVGESAQPAQYGSQTFKQRSVKRWGVLIVARSLNDASGARSAAQIDELKTEVDMALLGFTPTGAINAIQMAGNAGQLRRWDKDHYFYTAFYEAEQRICKTGA